jgi:hypothetical protein
MERDGESPIPLLRLVLRAKSNALKRKKSLLMLFVVCIVFSCLFRLVVVVDLFFVFVFVDLFLFCNLQIFIAIKF